MLKIKDNVDLKELERFGFEVEEKGLYSVRIPIDRTYSADFIKVLYKHISVLMTGEAGFLYDETLHLLFDLIQAGLVEKVLEVDDGKKKSKILYNQDILCNK